MKNKTILVTLSALGVSLFVSLPAFAWTNASRGDWQLSDGGWRWQNYDDTYAAGDWFWLDGNHDGISEYYYLGDDGYTLSGAETPDGNFVGESGAWTEDTENHITLNQELAGMMNTADSLNYFPDREIYLEDSNATTYSAEYEGIPILLYSYKETDRKNSFITAYAPAGLFFNKIPDQGIDVDSFYDGNTNFEALYERVYPIPTGIDGQKLGLDGKTAYTRTELRIQKRGIAILLTLGADGSWYIYPGSPAYMWVSP